jgi:ETC complex I subunit-like protein
MFVRCHRAPEPLYRHHIALNRDSTMPARIYKPSKTAMQSGFANTKAWVLDFEPEAPRQVEPLMGWTSSGDMRQQLRLLFDSKEEAIAYCERRGIPYQVTENVPLKRRIMSYADNFSFKRRDAWTH